MDPEEKTLQSSNNTTVEAGTAEYQDCLGCRLVGTGTLVGVSGYLLTQRYVKSYFTI